MGVIALGIGFATPLALAGVAVHIVGPRAREGARLLRRRAAARPRAPRRRRTPSTGIGRTQPALGDVDGHLARRARRRCRPRRSSSSEVLIVAGGFQAGRPWAAAAAALLLALGFLGLAHALIETTVGKRRRRDRRAAAAASAASTALTGASRRRCCSR